MKPITIYITKDTKDCRGGCFWAGNKPVYDKKNREWIPGKGKFLDWMFNEKIKKMFGVTLKGGPKSMAVRQITKI